MKILQKTKLDLTHYLTFFYLVLLLSVSFSASTKELTVDDFSDELNNSMGIPRQHMTDTVAGGSTKSEYRVTSGVINITGKIVPPRGQPGWASTVLILEPTGQAFNAEEFEGIRLVMKIKSGKVSLSANSVEVTNYDYHSSQVNAISDGEFHELKVPFNTLRRSWSEQTPLNKKSINSLSIVAFDIQPSDFNFSIDEVSFY